MISILEKIMTLWIRRWARPDAAALEAIRNLEPTVVVTGASRGIGLAIAMRFAALGERVVLVARNQSLLETALREVAAAGKIPPIALSLDLTVRGAPEGLLQALAARGLYCRTLVNNAGVGASGAFHTIDPERLDTLLALNVAAVTRLTRAVLPEMMARGEGGVLTIASLGGYVPGPNQAAYYASKAYQIWLARALKSEIAGRGVRMSVAIPGPVETGFHADMGAENALYRRSGVATTAERAARSVVTGYRLGMAVVPTGLLNFLAAVLIGLLPHAITVPITGWLLADRGGGRR